LINDILDLSKLEAGRLEAHCGVFDVHAPVERVIASMQATAGAKKLFLHFEVAPELREIVTDRRRVEQILLNLISNALKFTERGRVTLTVDATGDVSTPAPGRRDGARVDEMPASGGTAWGRRDGREPMDGRQRLHPDNSAGNGA